jgi:hypothetical protein
MPNHGSGGGEMNALQGNILGKTPAPPDATGFTTATAAIGVRHHPPPPHTSASTEASTIMTLHPTALAHVTPAVMTFGMHPQQQQQQHASHGVPSIATNTGSTIPHNSYATTPLHPATYYPSQGHDAISTVIMNHPYQHVHANSAAVEGAPNNNHASSSSFAVNDTSTSPLRQQQQQQQQQPLVQHHHDDSDKPLVQDTTTTHQGGRGNLAHCA